ncbi:MAG: aldehyde ferredoxin oxidoreductase C-terminal domain-containing protein [Candidatus Hydrothermarchaeales archaeon]
MVICFPIDLAGNTVPLKEMPDEYYELRSWEDGKPKPSKLRELGLDWKMD